MVIRNFNKKNNPPMKQKVKSNLIKFKFILAVYYLTNYNKIMEIPIMGILVWEIYFVTTRAENFDPKRQTLLINLNKNDKLKYFKLKVKTITGNFTLVELL